MRCGRRVTGIRGAGKGNGGGFVFFFFYLLYFFFYFYIQVFCLTDIGGPYVLSFGRTAGSGALLGLAQPPLFSKEKICEFDA